MMLYVTRIIYCALFILSISADLSAQNTKDVSLAEKKKFLRLLDALPMDSDHEFFTEESVNKAAPFIRTLFALTEEDIDKDHIPPLLGLSRDLCDREESRAYSLNSFQTIRHPIIKLFWGAVLFDEGVATQQIVEYLRTAITSNTQSKTLSNIVGTKYEEFKQRVLTYPTKK